MGAITQGERFIGSANFRKQHYLRKFLLIRHIDLHIFNNIEKHIHIQCNDTHRSIEYQHVKSEKNE